MPASVIPAALQALVALADAALPDTQVTGGQPLDAETTSDLFIGYDPEVADAVTSRREWASIGDQRQVEEFDVACYLRVWTGDEDDETAEQTRAFGLLDDLAQAIADDYTLGNVLDSGAALISAFSLRRVQDERGLATAIAFTVTCDSRI